MQTSKSPRNGVVLHCGTMLVLLGSIFSTVGRADEPARYTRLAPATPRIIASSEAFPGGSYQVENILQPISVGRPTKEFASHGLGVKTFIDFDFDNIKPIGAFQHRQRMTPDTIAESVLIFSNQADFAVELERVTIKHVDEPGGLTNASFAAIRARYVRWQVTKILPGRSLNVGGLGLSFFAATTEAETSPTALAIEMESLPIIERQNDRLAMPIRLTIDYPYAEPQQAALRVTGQPDRMITLSFSQQQIDIVHTTNSKSIEQLTVAIDIAGRQVASQRLDLDPNRQLTVYILPHSHTDIGYTAIQTDIEEKQINNLLQGIAEAKRTADYPEGARFVWNVEVVWAADLFLNRLSGSQATEFLEAVKHGQVALNGMYLNELTGLCRPEELVRLFRYATKLSASTNTPLESAMISDVPGYTWGTVTAMNQAGIKYFSVAPNYFDRIGDILVQWENKPFWWIGPDGQSRVLVWIPFRGYAMSHIYRQLTPRFVTEFCEGLKSQRYPYEVAYIRWSGHGDNAVPDASICEFVREWNEHHTSPRFIIASTSDAFRAFETRYGDQIPQVRGDWTPYWEDGAGSSSAETAQNRRSAERMSQAEAIWAMLAPARFPATKFDTAWNQILLYSEHTWGAHCSITQPNVPFTMDQWNIKQSFATTANLQSRQLLSESVQSQASDRAGSSAGQDDLHNSSRSTVDIYNTSSWSRTELVLLPRELSQPGNTVLDDQGQPIPAQRLANDELAVFVRDLPPFAGRRYTVTNDARSVALDDTASASGATLKNGQLTLGIDESTGAVSALRARGIDTNLVDVESGHGVNDYLYLIGDDISALQRNGRPTISVRDKGPLVASLVVESEAPGCHSLVREVRLTAGTNYAELLNTVDKKRLVAASYMAAAGKESVNFAFPFRVPAGNVRLDVPLGVMRPEVDQIPSACKNWFTIGRWGDVSNTEYGVTWVSLDAPLLQVGGITATLLNSQTDPNVWRKHVESTQKLYSWAMNNHWGTNYRAFQDGPTQFRYVIRPHHSPCHDSEAYRFATQFSQPLVAVPGRGPAPSPLSRVRIEPADVVVTGLKPSDDGNAIIVRLLNLSDAAASTTFAWSEPTPTRLWRSDTSERGITPLDGELSIPARGFVTIRAEFVN